MFGLPVHFATAARSVRALSTGSCSIGMKKQNAALGFTIKGMATRFSNVKRLH